MSEWARRGERVLDLGWSHPRVADAFLANGYPEFVGFGLASEADAAIEIQDPVTPLASSRFDVVLLLYFLSALADPQREARLVAEAHRLLRAEGRLVIWDLGRQRGERWAERYARGIQATGRQGTFAISTGAVFHHFTLDRIEELLHPGFAALRFERKAATTVWGRAAEGFECIAQKAPE